MVDTAPGRGRRLAIVGVAVMIFHRLRADVRPLTPPERRFLAGAGFPPARRAEWIRGRRAAHQVLPAGTSVLTARDGAPVLRGVAGRGVSISHDGPWVAVATSGGARAVAIDVVPRAHAARLRPVLARLAPAGRAAVDDPVRAWAALECALKLRRISITAILDRRLGLRRRGRAVVVTGLGAPVRVRFATAGHGAAIVVAVAVAG